MADWKDDLIPGSFRGVPFFIDSHEFSSGRRNVDHEFPSKEEGNSEDIGRRLPRHSLSLYVLGDDYFADRDALRKALDKKGPGALEHPYLGKVGQVQVSIYALSERVEEGRIARFQVEFVKAGIAKFPAENTDFFSSLIAAVVSVVNSAKSVLTAVMDVVGFPSRVASAAEDVVDFAADEIDAVSKIVGKGADSVSDIAFSIRNIKADVEAIVRAPAELANRFEEAFDLLFGAAADFKQLAQALSNSTSNFEPETPGGADTTTADQIRGNQIAIEDLIIELSLATQARAVISGNYLSVEEAVFFRDQVNADIDRQLLRTASDDTYQFLRDTQAQIQAALPPAVIGELIEFTPPKRLPALVISHILFGNVSKEQEIIDQNNVRHPGFVPGQIPIKVSTSA